MTHMSRDPQYKSRGIFRSYHSPNIQSEEVVQPQKAGVSLANLRMSRMLSSSSIGSSMKTAAGSG